LILFVVLCVVVWLVFGWMAGEWPGSGPGGGDAVQGFVKLTDVDGHLIQVRLTAVTMLRAKKRRVVADTGYVDVTGTLVRIDGEDVWVQERLSEVFERMRSVAAGSRDVLGG
jgi:hypothetical protein